MFDDDPDSDREFFHFVYRSPLLSRPWRCRVFGHAWRAGLGITGKSFGCRRCDALLWPLTSEEVTQIHVGRVRASSA